ncbi:rhodanese-related sulfurtransferase [Gelidibacter algens]|jgi:rhodanese-related sulfurtransferase|uniref:Rhodanese-related sulfurtransferase n=1 Tax=Gelidibacter algens TaxID=49280 RepID=A0A1A7QR07_9FLAO|nr:rhodanese-like domain-containing protein [Gelidibacter algens]OBX21634.1 rhodanese [Gelidibacter algens]RAJ24738.1 rhodanese-related sulfurtransferase [Gelidibacter algens]
MTLFSSIFGIKKYKNEAIKVLDAQTFKDSISHKKVQLIDVRSSNEFKFGHIKDAKNIDFYSDKFTAEFNKLDKQKPVYIYCRSGSRSRQSSNKLSTMGFTEIYDLKGGILNYK